MWRKYGAAKRTMEGSGSDGLLSGVRPAGLRRSVALAVLREAGADGVTVEEFRAAIGSDADAVIDELRVRGHCISTRPLDAGRVVLHVCSGTGGAS